MDIDKIMNKMMFIIKEQYKNKYFFPNNYIFFVSKKMWKFIRKEWGGNKDITELRYRGFSIFYTNILNNDIILFGKIYSGDD